MSEKWIERSLFDIYIYIGQLSRNMQNPQVFNLNWLWMSNIWSTQAALSLQAKASWDFWFLQHDSSRENKTPIGWDSPWHQEVFRLTSVCNRAPFHLMRLSHGTWCLLQCKLRSRTISILFNKMKWGPVPTQRFNKHQKDYGFPLYPYIRNKKLCLKSVKIQKT